MTKRYTITSTQFEGELTFAYADTGVLVSFFNDALLTEEQVAFLAQHFPMTLPYLERIAGNSQTMTIRMTTHEPTFEEFFQAYDYPIKKQRCQEIWDKLTPADRNRACDQIPVYSYYLQLRPGQNRMYPDTWLRTGCHEDWKVLAKTLRSGS